MHNALQRWICCAHQQKKNRAIDMYKYFLQVSRQIRSCWRIMTSYKITMMNLKDMYCKLSHFGPEIQILSRNLEETSKLCPFSFHNSLFDIDNNFKLRQKFLLIIENYQSVLSFDTSLITCIQNLSVFCFDTCLLMILILRVRKVYLFIGGF